MAGEEHSDCGSEAQSDVGDEQPGGHSEVKPWHNSLDYDPENEREFFGCSKEYEVKVKGSMASLPPSSRSRDTIIYLRGGFGYELTDDGKLRFVEKKGKL